MSARAGKIAGYALALGFLFLPGCGVSAAPAGGLEGGDTQTHRGLSFADLDGWSSDDQSASLLAFRRSCARIVELDGDALLDPKSSASIYGTAGDWRAACEAAAHVAPGAGAARAYFERWFAPVRLGDSGASLFTGYYEPEMKGALAQGGPYQTPVIAMPPAFAAMRAAGEPLPTRAEIEDMMASGKLDAAGVALVWLADPVDAFFLHVQGSGRVRLEDGRVMRLAFAAKNERPYTSIGKLLIERGAIAKDDVSMQTIRAWLEAHPSEIHPLLRQNQSYIFFKRLDDGMDPALGPPGAEKVNLTPGRSLAVDRSLHPLGSLYWLDTTVPVAREDNAAPFRRLMVAQDTGTAIRGLQRGDVFWGFGADAAEIAGRMKQPGELIALLPRSLAPGGD
ncbi:MAG TPA: MltA domain-containing protein [Parvibaculum sp.]